MKNKRKKTKIRTVQPGNIVGLSSCQCKKKLMEGQILNFLPVLKTKTFVE